MHSTSSNDFLYIYFETERMEGPFSRKIYDCVKYVKQKTQIDGFVLNLFLQQSKTITQKQEETNTSIPCLSDVSNVSYFYLD